MSMSDEISPKKQAEAIAEFLATPDEYQLHEGELDEILQTLYERGQLSAEDVELYGREVLQKNIELASKGEELNLPDQKSLELSAEEELDLIRSGDYEVEL